jgi:hypothetical protein
MTRVLPSGFDSGLQTNLGLRRGASRQGRGDLLSGAPPQGALEGPSPELAGDKERLGAERISPWFGRDWTPLGMAR